MRRAAQLLALLLAALAAAAAAPARTAASGPLVERGKSLYGEYCVACHGANGEGRVARSPVRGFGPGREQQRGPAVAPPLRGVGALAADFYLRTGYMPLPRLGVQPRRRGHLLLDDGEIRALVAYVASLGKGPAIPQPHPENGDIAAGTNLFTEHCAGCHQVVAQGGYVTGAVAPPLEDATATQIAEAVRIGPYVMPTFTEKALSDGELDSIIRYVQYAAKHPSNEGGWGIGFIGPVPEGLVTWFLAAAALVLTCVVIGKRLSS